MQWVIRTFGSLVLLWVFSRTKSLLNILNLDLEHHRICGIRCVISYSTAVVFHCFHLGCVTSMWKIVLLRPFIESIYSSVWDPFVRLVILYFLCSMHFNSLARVRTFSELALELTVRGSNGFYSDDYSFYIGTVCHGQRPSSYRGSSHRRDFILPSSKLQDRFRKASFSMISSFCLLTAVQIRLDAQQVG